MNDTNTNLLSLNLHRHNKADSAIRMKYFPHRYQVGGQQL